MKHYSIFLVILFGLSRIAQANEILTAQERVAVSLLGSVMSIVSAKVEAGSCNELRGQYPLTLFATGVGGQRRQNNLVTVKLPVHPVSVFAYPRSKIAEVGLRVRTSYARTSNYNDFDPVSRYDAVYNFNSTGDLLVMVSQLTLKDPYQDTELLYSAGAISQFERSPSSDLENAYASNIGWGMSWLSSSKFPRSKNWQRFEMSRDLGIDGRTNFIRDLLVYRAPCQIKITLSGHNGSDFISQQGYLAVEMALPDGSVETE